jgi:DNA-binding XRE family transcriptional regulator
LDEWEICVTDEVREWITSLDDLSHRLVVQAIDILADCGPALGRPLVDHAEHSAVQNLKELRPGSAGRSELRILAEARGWRLAEIRRHRGLTQAQVASKMGVGKSRVSQIERGRVSTREVLDRYVEALGGRLSLVADFGDELLRVG